MFFRQLIVALVLAVIFGMGFVQLCYSQEPLTSDNPPPITVTPSDSVLDSLQSLRFNLDKAQANLDSLTPGSNFTSAAHRAAFYKAAADLKRANVAMFSYMAGVDPNNRLSWLQKARTSKRQYEVAMGEHYKALPMEKIVIEHLKRLSIN